MAEVPKLRRLSCLVTVQALLNLREDTSRESASRLRGLFGTDSYTAVSGLVLQEVLETYPSKLTNKILLCLVPPHAKQLSLKDCRRLTVCDIEGLLTRCRQLNKLDFSGCDQLLRPTFFRRVGHLSPQITSVSLVECSSASDLLVKNLLRSIPCLKHLNLSGCSAITDDAFLLNKESQVLSSIHPWERQRQSKFYSSCQLSSLNVSSCKQITSTGVHFITSLCGSSLQHVNISYTKACCDSLLHLAGYTMYSATRFLMRHMAWKDSSPQSNTSKENSDTQDIQDLKIEDIEDESSSGGSETGEGAVSEDTGADKEGNCVTGSCLPKESNIVNHQHNQQSPSSSKIGREGNHAASYSFLCAASAADTTNFQQSDSDSRKQFNSTNGTVQMSSDSETNNPATMSRETATLLADTVSAASHVTGTFKSDVCQCTSYDISFSGVSSDSEHGETRDAIPTEELKPLSGSETAIMSEGSSVAGDEANQTAAREEIPFRMNDKLEVIYKLYEPQLKTLEIDGINFGDVELGESHLREFFKTNTTLEKFSVSWSDLSDTMVSFIARCSPRLKSVSLVDCTSLTTFGLAELCMKCKELDSVNLQGVCFFGDAAMIPLISRGSVQRLNLAESNVTDMLLRNFALSCSDTLEELDLSWCDEIGCQDYRSLSDLVLFCGQLKRLALRQCKMDETTVKNLSNSCTVLEDLNLSSVNCLSDPLLVRLSMRLRELRKLDISWNSAVTDVGISAILTHCIQLQEANFAGTKQITTETFLPIISNAQQWKRSQALLRLKLHERETLDEQCSSDEEFEDLCLPHRSTVYAINLRWLNVEYCDQLNDTYLAEIVAVCRGTLKIRDYYGEIVEPKWVRCCNGQIFFAR